MSYENVFGFPLSGPIWKSSDPVEGSINFFEKK